MELSTVSSIVANLSGLTTGGLYLFLRGQIRPRLSSYKHETYDFDAKYFDKAGEKRGSYYAAGLDPSGRLSSPSIYSQNENGNISFSRNSDEKKLRGPIPGPESGNGTSLGMGGRPDLTEVLATTAPTGDSSKRESEAHSRSSYGFFTQYSPKAENTSPGLLPSTTYTPSSSRPPLESKRDNMLMPPPLFHAPKTGWHTRNSSVGSSQTVQIGLRISNMNEVQTMRSSQLHSPRQAQGLRSFAPVPASHDSSQAMGRAGHVKQPSSGSVELNKQLPKVPPESPAQHDEAQKRFTQLSPTVYEPQKQPPRARLASPKGVGFQTAPADRALRRGPQLSPSINAATEKGGWI